MKTASLFCFSGTGNTLLAARRLAAALELRGVGTSLGPLDSAGPVALEGDALGLAFPVACQSTYPFVWDFLEHLPPGGGCGVFVLDTLHSFSGGLLGPLRQLLEAKGYRPLGAVEVIMPSNLRLRTPGADREEAIRRQAMETVEAFADDLAEGRATWPTGGRSEAMLHRLSRARMTWGALRWVMNLRRDPQKCSSCGLCERLCPVGAIRLDREPSLDRRSCQSCMRCYSFCPVGAIRSRISWSAYHAVAAAEMLESGS